VYIWYLKVVSTFSFNSLTRHHNSVRNIISVIKVCVIFKHIYLVYEPHPSAMMHADSIREQLKKLLKRFNVRMISSEGTQSSLIMIATICMAYPTFMLHRESTACPDVYHSWLLCQCCIPSLHWRIQVITCDVIMT